MGVPTPRGNLLPIHGRTGSEVESREELLVASPSEGRTSSRRNFRHCSLNATEDLQGITNYNHAERRDIVVVIRDKSETIATEAEIRPRIEHG